ncbi:MAG TPA: hypothetical protein VF898_05615 [Chloroflexota bacterium]
MRILTLVMWLCAAVALSSAPPPALATSSKVGAITFIPFGKTHQAGLAIAGSRYVYAGTSTGNILHLIDVRTMQRVATWYMPGLGATTYGMDRLAVSPDNRRLYIANSARQDVVVVDTTAVSATKRWNLSGTGPLDVKISADSKRVYVIDRQGADIYDAATGRHLGRLPGVSEIAPGPNNGVYTITIARGHALVRWVTAGGKGRTLASWSGSTQTDLSGDIALSADGQVLYALWDSFREIDVASGRTLRSFPLPLVPHYRWISLAPNGEQAMLTAPNFAGISSTPGINAGYISSHFGFVAGGVVPVDLVAMRPIKASLQTVVSPHQLAYTSDSRWAFLTVNGGVDAITTGISGQDFAKLPQISVHPNGTGGTPATCNIAGAWTFVLAKTTGGLANGSSFMQQTGNTVTGTLTAVNGILWTLRGSIKGRGLLLTLHATGQTNLSYSGTVTSTGRSITGNLGTFTNGHAACT